MNETLEQIALRVAIDTANELGSFCMEDAEAIEFSRRLVAELAKQQEPVAWFVRRNAPGKRDDGMRLGPFWKKEDAEDWVDDRHILHALYAIPPTASQIEQETAEACASFVDTTALYDTSKEISEAIRSGAWKEFKKS